MLQYFMSVPPSRNMAVISRSRKLTAIVLRKTKRSVVAAGFPPFQTRVVALRPQCAVWSYSSIVSSWISFIPIAPMSLVISIQILLHTEAASSYEVGYSGGLWIYTTWGLKCAPKPQHTGISVFRFHYQKAAAMRNPCTCALHRNASATEPRRVLFINLSHM